ncbi:MAG: N-acetylgalactosamine-6-sulfatase, partial [Verrucomicrobiota bacterium]
GPQPDLAIRDGRWKLLCDHDGSNPRLHDLETDLAENRDLSASEPALVGRLTKAVLDWHRAMPPDAALGPAKATVKKKR